MEDQNTNMAVWFELPATDFKRAVTFYQSILDVEIVEIELAGFQQGLFPHDERWAVSGAIICGPGATPSREGSVVYLNGGEDLQDVLGRVEPAGGEVLTPKTLLSDEIGYIAYFLDSEGNRVALHSMS